MQKLGVVAHAFNLNIMEVKENKSDQGHPELHKIQSLSGLYKIPSRKIDK